MYKQQSYDTPTEEFFQPSEGWFTSDPEFVKITMDHLLNKKLVPKETLDMWEEWSENQKKTSKKKHNYMICKTLTDALHKLLNNIRKSMDNPFTDFSTQIVDNQAVKIFFSSDDEDKKDYIDIVLDININPEKYKDKTFEYIIFKDYCQSKCDKTHEVQKKDFTISFYDGNSKTESKQTRSGFLWLNKSIINKEIKQQYIVISFEKKYIYEFRDKNNETVFDTDKPSLHLAMKWLELKGFKKGENMDEVCTVYAKKADQAAQDLKEAQKSAQQKLEAAEKTANEQLETKQKELDKAQKELEATKQYFLLQTKHINKEKNELEVTLVGVREQLKSADEKTEEVTEALNLINKIIDKGNKIIIKNEENKKKENQNIEQKLIALMPAAVVKEIEKQRREGDKYLAEKLLAEQSKSKIALERRKAERAKKNKNANKQPDEPSEKTKEQLEKELAALQKQLNQKQG